MDSHYRIEVTDQQGWRKEYPLQKNIIYIGSAPGNDIVLEAERSAGVAPRHLQFIAVQGDPPGYRVINLGSTPILPDEPSQDGAVLSPRASMQIGDGTGLRLGNYTLVFRLGEPGRQERPSVAPALASAPQRTPYGATRGEAESANIGLKLHLSDTSLSLETPIEGTIVVRNMGNKPAVQFLLELDGLEPESYEMEPGPILFPDAEKEVFLRLHHPRKPYPPAGAHRISIRALAPESYPGQSAEVSQQLDILPFYSHKLRFVITEELETGSKRT